jgi:hypothetical protein
MVFISAPTDDESSSSDEFVPKACIGHIAPFDKSDTVSAKLEAEHRESYCT